MVGKVVEDILTNSGKSKSWLAKEMGGMPWSTLKDKIKKNTFSAEELITLCVILEDLNINDLIKERKLERLIASKKKIRITIYGNDAYRAAISLNKLGNIIDDEYIDACCENIKDISFTVNTLYYEENKILDKIKNMNYDFDYIIEVIE